MTSPAYTFASSEPTAAAGKTKKGKHKRGSTGGKPHQLSSHQQKHSSYDESEDPTDAGSLTYSAASSVQSGGSAAGESTDSSFADIMRVLDMQDSKELAALCKKEGVSTAGELKSRYHQRGRMGSSSAVSVTSSLNYSTDGESALEGTQLLQTIAGQPSDSYAFDGGSGGQKGRVGSGSTASGSGTAEEEPISDNDILFAPAAPADSHSKRKKDKERKHAAEKAAAAAASSSTTTKVASTPKAKNSYKYSSSPTSSPESSPVPAEPVTPPPPKPPPKVFVDEDEDEDIWYAKWWMSCFADSFKNLVPKR